MTGVGEAFRAVVALAFGGFLFIIIGGTVSSSLSGPALLDFRLWGAIYLFAAIVLAVGTVYAAAQTALS